MLTRRGLFSALVGAVAALVGLKMKPKWREVARFEMPVTLHPFATFAHPVVDMVVIHGDLYVTTARELWVLEPDGTKHQLARWGV